MDNPFRYGRVATGEFFVGREKELRDIENSANQRLVLNALVASDGSPAIYSESYRRAYGLGASSTVHRSVSALIDADLVKTTASGEHHVPDPFFRAWIARTAAIGANIRV